ncbi:hypothetical protein G4B88_023416 [Cannabis sativa]|uniref:Uncharacterized protein n=1 Tax=Cannabis sativa TaxID=3483 RepID=A0A7J6DJ56_CANSA|nr:hypothetical protein G4B88_023416 [Cannabis sativa]
MDCGVVRIDSEFYYSTSVDSSAAIQAKPFFRSLETLKFLDMKKFEEWSFIKGGVFPRLKNLYFQSCLRLKVTLHGKVTKNKKVPAVKQSLGPTINDLYALMRLISSTPLTTFDKTIKPEIEETLEKLKLLLDNKDLGLERCVVLWCVFKFNTHSPRLIDSVAQNTEWSFIEGGVFPRLKNLQLRGCERLKVTLLADYFPSLTDLEIDPSPTINELWKGIEKPDISEYHSLVKGFCEIEKRKFHHQGHLGRRGRKGLDPLVNFDTIFVGGLVKAGKLLEATEYVVRTMKRELF